MGKIIDRVRERETKATRRRVLATFPPTDNLRGKAAGRERALNAMTERILANRERHPHQTVHCAAVSIPRGVAQLLVGRWIPAMGIRDCLAVQLDAISAQPEVR